MSILTDKELFEILGDQHHMTSSETPMRLDAFLKSDVQKMTTIE